MRVRYIAKDVFRRNKREILFFVRFVLLFGVLMLIHFLSRFHTAYFLVYKWTTVVSARIINLFDPAQNASALGQVIQGRGLRLTIARGCEGIEGMLLVVAALAAFPMGWKTKLGGILTGILLIYAANIGRIVGLYFAFHYRPAMFDFMHIYVGQTFTIFFGVFFFIIWTGLFAHETNAANQNA